jgi:hypothetical protein
VSHQLAQFNLGRIRGPVDSEVMREFMAALDEINALAERSAGFVWRFKTDSGNATSVVAFSDPLILVNLSVWTDVESLRNYVYQSDHGRFFARRASWFERMEGPQLALWWVPAGTVPTIEDGKARLAALAGKGETPWAFTFRRPFGPPA